VKAEASCPIEQASRTTAATCCRARRRIDSVPRPKPQSRWNWSRTRSTESARSFSGGFGFRRLFAGGIYTTPRLRRNIAVTFAPSRPNYRAGAVTDDLRNFWRRRTCTSSKGCAGDLYPTAFLAVSSRLRPSPRLGSGELANVIALLRPLCGPRRPVVSRIADWGEMATLIRDRNRRNATLVWPLNSGDLASVMSYSAHNRRSGRKRPIDISILAIRFGELNQVFA